MKFDNIDVSKTVEQARKMLITDKSIAPSVKLVIELLLTIIDVFFRRLTTNSKNSSKAPSTDPNREKKPKNDQKKKAGGQDGHVGKTLEFASDPDEIIELKLDEKSLPKGQYTEAGYEARQVVNIRIKRHIIEYRAQALQNQNGKKFTASFPAQVLSKIQYGTALKAHSVYMSCFQMVPYSRIGDHFADQMKVPVSVGSIYNFNQEAYEKLEKFEEIVKDKLIDSRRINVDETGINIGGKRKWLHTACNDLWAHYYPHDKRGSEAMDEIGILPKFSGVACHDHWSSYYTYQCLHSLCNAHHIRELESVIEHDKQLWAKYMQDLLCEINEAVAKAGGVIKSEVAVEYRKRYREILAIGDTESPAPDAPEGKAKKRGRIKKSKSRNLLERLRNFEDDVLRFMELDFVPFTNNLAESALRMVKVQQKISGCFRTMDGAKIFCRIRSYIVTCQKHGMSPTDALNTLFEGNLPDFCTNTS